MTRLVKTNVDIFFSPDRFRLLNSIRRSVVLVISAILLNPSTLTVVVLQYTILGTSKVKLVFRTPDVGEGA